MSMYFLESEQVDLIVTALCVLLAVERLTESTIVLDREVNALICELRGVNPMNKEETKHGD